MSAIDKIYNYFDREPDLKVLFIFNDEFYFHQESPLQKKSLRESFPLLDVLTANMEYKSQDYTAFMQQCCGRKKCCACSRPIIRTGTYRPTS